MNFLLVFIVIAIVYLLFITYIHHCIMRECIKQDNTPATRKVLGIITDTRPNNLINKDLKNEKSI